MCREAQPYPQRGLSKARWMAGFKKAMEVLPAILVCGVTFALAQYVTASFIGPYLPDITASLAAMAALVILLRLAAKTSR